MDRPIDSPASPQQPSSPPAANGTATQTANDTAAAPQHDVRDHDAASLAAITAASKSERYKLARRLFLVPPPQPPQQQQQKQQQQQQPSRAVKPGSGEMTLAWTAASPSSPQAAVTTTSNSSSSSSSSSGPSGDAGASDASPSSPAPAGPCGASAVASPPWDEAERGGASQVEPAALGVETLSVAISTDERVATTTAAPTMPPSTAAAAAATTSAVTTTTTTTTTAKRNGSLVAAPVELPAWITTAAPQRRKTTTTLSPTDSALAQAAEKGDVTAVQRITATLPKDDVVLAVNVGNKYGRSPLHLACAQGHKETARVLIQLGAVVDRVDDDGRTPLHMAVKNGHSAVASFLVRISSARVGHRDNDEWTPLMVAASNGHVACAQILLEGEAGVNDRNREGWTPLMLAVFHEQENVVRFLLQNGAKADIAKQDGKTALDVAVECNFDEIANILRNHKRRSSKVIKFPTPLLTQGSLTTIKTSQTPATPASESEPSLRSTLSTMSLSTVAASNPTSPLTSPASSASTPSKPNGHTPPTSALIKSTEEKTEGFRRASDDFLNIAPVVGGGPSKHYVQSRPVPAAIPINTTTAESACASSVAPTVDVITTSTTTTNTTMTKKSDVQKKDKTKTDKTDGKKKTKPKAIDCDSSTGRRNSSGDSGSVKSTTTADSVSLKGEGGPVVVTPSIRAMVVDYLVDSTPEGGNSSPSEQMDSRIKRVMQTWVDDWETRESTTGPSESSNPGAQQGVESGVVGKTNKNGTSKPSTISRISTSSVRRKSVLADDVESPTTSPSGQPTKSPKTQKLANKTRNVSIMSSIDDYEGSIRLPPDGTFITAKLLILSDPALSVVVGERQFGLRVQRHGRLLKVKNEDVIVEAKDKSLFISFDEE